MKYRPERRTSLSRSPIVRPQATSRPGRWSPHTSARGDGARPRLGTKRVGGARERGRLELGVAAAVSKSWSSGSASGFHACKLKSIVHFDNTLDGDGWCRDPCATISHLVWQNGGFLLFLQSACYELQAPYAATHGLAGKGCMQKRPKLSWIRIVLNVQTPVGRVKLTTKMLSALVAIAVFLVLLNVQVVEGEEANKCLAILVFATILWATEAIPLFVTSTMIPMLLVVLRVIRSEDGEPLSPPAATKHVFSVMFSPTIMLLIGGFTIASALSKTAIDRVIITKVLSLAGTRPSIVLLAFMGVACFASMWISNVAAPTLCFTLIQPILRTLPARSSFAPCLIIGIALAANIGGQSSPISSPQNLIALSAMDPPLDWGSWFAVSLPSGEGEIEVKPVRPPKERFSAKQWWVSFVCLLTIALWCVAHSIQDVIGDMGVIAIIPIIAFFSTGVLKKDDFEQFLWTVVFIAMGGIALGNGVTNSGLLEVLGDGIRSMIYGLDLYPVVLLLAEDRTPAGHLHVHQPHPLSESATPQSYAQDIAWQVPHHSQPNPSASGHAQMPPMMHHPQEHVEYAPPSAQQSFLSRHPQDPFSHHPPPSPSIDSGTSSNGLSFDSPQIDGNIGPDRSLSRRRLRPHGRVQSHGELPDYASMTEAHDHVQNSHYPAHQGSRPQTPSGPGAPDQFMHLSEQSRLAFNTPPGAYSRYPPFSYAQPQSRSTSGSATLRDIEPALGFLPLCSVASSALTSVSSSASAPNSQVHPPFQTADSPQNVRKEANKKKRLYNTDRREICVFAQEHPGVKQEDIAAHFGVERSTVSKILKHKARWLSVAVDEEVLVAKMRPSKFPELEYRLAQWVKTVSKNGTVLSDALLRQRAREIELQAPPWHPARRMDGLRHG
ncbi:hypothetical protein NUW54_g10318 [Trametes sanguinea]|uniref:Uncharacterized protein n=1 Tax=Trametes sanguinea TaxID=158606 RepID=A0ACC1P019_9APHY|nr:hypothetical protein NUW54_g10318 [Trametes sanguinea]